MSPTAGLASKPVQGLALVVAAEPRKRLALKRLALKRLAHPAQAYPFDHFQDVQIGHGVPMTGALERERPRFTADGVRREERLAVGPLQKLNGLGVTPVAP